MKKYTAVAAKDEAARPEADLRLGYLQLRQFAHPHNNDEALAALEVVDYATRDSMLVIARLFRGLVDECLNRPHDAFAAYVAALKIAPGAHSATIAGAALLARQASSAWTPRT